MLIEQHNHENNVKKCKFIRISVYTPIYIYIYIYLSDKETYVQVLFKTKVNY